MMETLARRRTADNVSVLLTQDAEGLWIGSRFECRHSAPLEPEVAWAVMGELELGEYRELTTLINAARKLSKSCKLTPGALRRAAWGQP
jgi:hypothetical protein